MPKTDPQLTEALIDVAALKVKVDNLTETNKAMQRTLLEIQSTLSEARGGWRLLMLVGGAGAALAGFAAWAINHINIK